MTATARAYAALPSGFTVESDRFGTAAVEVPPYPPGRIGCTVSVAVVVSTAHGAVKVRAMPDRYGWRPEPGPISVTVDPRALPAALVEVCPDALTEAVEDVVRDALRVATGEGWWFA